MPSSANSKSLKVARESLAHPMAFEEFLAKLAPKDKVNAERRVSVLEAEADASRAHLWRRLVSALMTLSPHAAKFVGKQTVQFYIADGKYRMQVFAMEDLQDGNFTIYAPDALDEAVKTGLLEDAEPAEEHSYFVPASKEPLRVERLDGNSINSGAHYKDLTGWNRKAVRITLPPSASPKQIEAAEVLCALAAQHFVRAKPSADSPSK